MDVGADVVTEVERDRRIYAVMEGALELRIVFLELYEGIVDRAEELGCSRRVSSYDNL